MQERRVNRGRDKSYTLQEVKEWETELENIPTWIAEQKQVIARHQEDIKPLAITLAEVNNRIAPIDAKINAIHARLELIRLDESDIAARREEKTREEELTKLQAKKKLLHLIRVKEAQEGIDRCTRDKLHLELDVLPRLQRELAEEIRKKKEVEAHIEQKHQEMSDKRVIHHPEHNAPRPETHHGLLDDIMSFLHLLDGFNPQHTRDQLTRAATRQEELEREIREHERRIRETEDQIARFRQTEDNAGHHIRSHATGANLQHLYSQYGGFVGPDEEHSINDKIDNVNHRLDELRATLVNNQSRRTQITPIAREFLEVHDISTLRNNLAHWEREKAPHAEQRRQLEIEIGAHETAISRARDKISYFQNRKRTLESNQFLMSFRDSPNELLASLARRMKSKIQEFDEENPADQSDAVQTIAREVGKNIDLICETKPEPGAANNLHARQQCQVLIGYCWSLLDRVDGPEENFDFGSVLMSLLRENCLNSGECKNAFASFRQGLQDWLVILPDELNKQRLSEYSAASREFGQRIAAITPQNSNDLQKLKKRGQELHESMEKHKAKDMRYCTTVLRTSNQLLASPKNEVLQNQLEFLADKEKSGAPSICKRIGGAILAFLGALIVVGSSFAPSPLSISGWVVGGAMILAGIGLYRSGVRKGVSKQEYNFVEAARKVKTATRVAETGETTNNQVEGVYTPLIGLDTSVQCEGTKTMPEPSAPPMSAMRL